MNNLNLKILLVIGGMLSTPVFALSQSLLDQMDRVDSAAASVVPSGPQTTPYQKYVQQQIDSLSGFGPVDPFMQCNLVKFQLSGDQTGFTTVGGSSNSCATSSGLNPAGSSTGPSGGRSGSSGSSSGNSGQGLGGGNSNNPHVPDWWGGGVFQ